MAKRELIDKTEIDKIFAHTKANDEIIGTYERISDLQPITEEEIVKPYLEKLSNEICEAYEEYDGYDPNALGQFEEKIQELINNLLTE